MTTATEPVSEAPATPETEPEAAVAEPQGEAQPEAPGAPRFNPDSLSADVKAFVDAERKRAADETSKKYADHDRYRQAAQEWEGVRNDPRFQQWADGLRRPEPPKPFEVSDEAYAAVLSGDKGAFVAAVQAAAKHLMEQTVGPQLESVKQHNDFQAKVGELQQTVAKFPDFKDLDKRGLIEPIIRKYPNMSFEDAYKIAKHSTINEEADRRARGIVDGKKKATVERPGTPSAAKGSRVSARNREEAMNMVAEAIRAGRPVPEFDEIGD